MSAFPGTTRPAEKQKPAVTPVSPSVVSAPAIPSPIPSIAKGNDKIYSQKDLEDILNKFTQNNPSLTAVQAMITRSVADELKNIGNSGPNNVTKFLRLPYVAGNYYKTAEWGPGGGGMPFSGNVRVGNKPVIIVDPTEGGATGFLSVNLDGSGYTWAGSMPTSQPADAWVFDLSQTAGDICIFGNIAPGG
jgi:hypothetical protein